MTLPTLSALILIVLHLSFGHSGEASAVAIHEVNCNTDHDCSSGEFCFQSNRISYCSKCVECRIYNRKSRGCARSRSDCDKCLPGFDQQGAHCSPRVKVPVMGYYEEHSKFHHGNPEKSHTVLLVCGIGLVLIVTVVKVLPYPNGTGAAGSREQARQSPNHLDPSVAVPRNPLWDPSAATLSENEPSDLTSKSPAHAHPSHSDEGERVVPVSDILSTYEAGSDCNEGIELPLSPPADPNDLLSSLIWNVLQQGPEQIEQGSHDAIGSELLSENSMDFTGVVLDEEGENFMEVDANEGENAELGPQEQPPAILQQFVGAVDEESLYHPQ